MLNYIKAIQNSNIIQTNKNKVFRTPCIHHFYSPLPFAQNEKQIYVYWRKSLSKD